MTEEREGDGLPRPNGLAMTKERGGGLEV